MLNDVFVVGARRTAIGSFMGQFAELPAPRLGAHVIKSAVAQSGLSADKINEVIMGEVLTAGVGQAPARQAALGAGLPNSVPCLTINKVCGSGLKAVMLASDNIRLGSTDVAVAGGQENMSLAPHLMEKSRAGFRMGNAGLTDSMIKDGLWDPYNNFHMGNAAELCVREYKFTREQQDQFAIDSYKKAHAAQKNGWLKNEIAALEIATKTGPQQILEDEEPGKARFDKMPSLKAAFDKEGTITAANASKINDGAAALVLASGNTVKSKGLKPLARIVAHSTYAQDPKWFTTAPVGAIKKNLEVAGVSAKDVDLWEINEAFSVVTMVAIKDLGLDPARVNIHGGAVAFGHPIGASGARLLTTLIYALHTHQKRYGIASLCIGGGEGVSLLVERV